MTTLQSLLIAAKRANVELSEIAKQNVKAKMNGFVPALKESKYLPPPSGKPSHCQSRQMLCRGRSAVDCGVG